MLKKTVKYTDFDDQPQVDTLWFNLSETRILDNIDIEDQLSDLQKVFEEEPRQLTRPEVRAMLELVKRLMKMSYGVRIDAKHFRQNDEVWEDFADSAAYNAFLLSLFTNPEEAYAFIVAILPKEIRDGAKQKMVTDHPELADFVNEVPTAQAAPSVEQGVTVEADSVPLWKREGRLPNQEEARNLSKEELLEAYQQKASK